MQSIRIIFTIALMCISTALLAQNNVVMQREIQDTIAKNTSDSIKEYDIATVTVTGSYAQTKREVFPVQMLTGDALKGFAAYSVADALRYFSGIQIKDYGGTGGLKTVNIRSMGTNHVGVCYDGIELGNAQNGTIDLGKFSLDNMESVALYNGQKSDLLQSAKDYGSAGNIYLQSRTPRFAIGSKSRVSVTMKGGSFLTLNPSLLWEQKVSEKVSLSLSAEYLYTSGRYRFTYTNPYGYDTTAMRQNGDVQALRAELGFYGTTAAGQWRVKGYFYSSERGYPGAVVRGKFYHQDRQWDNNLFVQAQWQNTWKFYTLIVKGKYAYDYLHYLSDPNLDVSTMYVENHYQQHEAYLSLINHFNIKPWWEVAVSADVQLNSMNADLLDFVYPVRLSCYGAASTAFKIPHFRGQIGILGHYVHDRLRASDSIPDDRWVASPSLFLSYRPWLRHDLTLRAFAKNSVRMPTFNDLYYTFIGSSSLKPESTTQYDLGIHFNKPMNKWCELVSIQVDGYFNQVKNKIIAIPTSNFFRWTMLNLGYVEIVGIDIAAQANFAWGKGFTAQARATYTYQSARDLTDPNDPFYGGQIPYIPWHSMSATANLGYKSWQLHYSFIYTGHRYDSQANRIEDYILPWYTHDLSLSKQFYWQKANLNLTLDINNLFNQQYEVVRNYPMPGTNFKITAQITFQ
ncbi:MAG: TonB-dependent receptor plug domain-containing protein [Bacteroidales bacterium]|nr:TonB-dependent receptor plug domain-containing protein [Bacteroidales bacterium]